MMESNIAAEVMIMAKFTREEIIRIKAIAHAGNGLEAYRNELKTFFGMEAAFLMVPHTMYLR